MSNAVPYVYGPTCEPCGSAETDPTPHRNVLGFGVDLVRCRGCGLKRYLRPVLSQEAINDGPGAHELADRVAVMGSMTNFDPARAEETRAFISSYYGGMVRRIREISGELRSLFEVGFNVGDFLAAACHEGVRFLGGCEPNGRGVDVARSRLQGGPEGLVLQHAFFRNAPSYLPVWDAVVMLDVIEHTDEPRADLERAFRHLRPGGVLLLKTFYDEWHEGRILDLGPRVGYGGVGQAGYFGPDGHLWHFDRPVLRALTERVGFRIVRWEEDPVWGQVTLYAVRP